LLSSYDLHAQHNTHTIANWIHAYDPFFKDSIKKAQTKSISNTKSIASYLSPLGIAKNRPKINPYQKTFKQRARKVFADIQKRVTPHLQSYFPTPTQKQKRKLNTISPTHTQTTNHTQVRNIPNTFTHTISHYFNKTKGTK